MSELAFNVWGAVAGAIGIVTVLPALAFWSLGRFPTSKLLIVEKSLADAQRQFHEAVTSGLVHGEDKRLRFHDSLWCLESRVVGMQAEVYNIRSWRDEFTHWRNGLSREMSVICQDLRTFRGKLARNSSRERRMLAAEGNRSKLASWSGLAERVSYPLLGSPSYHPPTQTPTTLLQQPQPCATVFSTSSIARFSRVRDCEQALPSTVSHNHRSNVEPVEKGSRTCLAGGAPYVSPDTTTYAPPSDADLKQLLGDIVPTGAPPRRHAKRSRLMDVRHLLQGADGARLSFATAEGHALLDLEVLASRLAGYGGDEEWDDA